MQTRGHDDTSGGSPLYGRTVAQKRVDIRGVTIAAEVFAHHQRPMIPRGQSFKFAAAASVTLRAVISAARACEHVAQVQQPGSWPLAIDFRVL